MDAKTFARIEAIAKTASYRPTNAEQKEACKPIGALSPEQKVAALRRFVDRDARLRDKGGGDWVAWVFVTGVVGSRERLPWTREDIEHVLRGVIDESRVLPPELVVRAVKDFIASAGPLGASTKKLVQRAARSMWPPGSTEGVNFKKAAAALQALLRAK